jgi:hypothetical protein
MKWNGALLRVDPLVLGKDQVAFAVVNVLSLQEKRESDQGVLLVAVDDDKLDISPFLTPAVKAPLHLNHGTFLGLRPVRKKEGVGLRRVDLEAMVTSPSGIDQVCLAARVEQGLDGFVSDPPRAGQKAIVLGVVNRARGRVDLAVPAAHGARLAGLEAGSVGQEFEEIRLAKEVSKRVMCTRSPPKYSLSS